MEILEELLPIILPFVAYIASGVVMIIKIIGQIKTLTKKTDENKETTANQISNLEDQLILANQENAELRKEVKRLANKIDKIMEE